MEKKRKERKKDGELERMDGSRRSNIEQKKSNPPRNRVTAVEEMERRGDRNLNLMDGRRGSRVVVAAEQQQEDEESQSGGHQPRPDPGGEGPPPPGRPPEIEGPPPHPPLRAQHIYIYIYLFLYICMYVCMLCIADVIPMLRPPHPSRQL